VHGPYAGVADLAAAPVRFLGAADFDRFGRDVAAGDLDGDGFDEVIIGAPRAAGAGAVWVFRGGTCP
jgi:hypothetical protein